MNDLTLDWWWLYLQVAVLGAILGRELLRSQGRNLYAILIPGVMLALVQGQAWWMLKKFDQNGGADVRHLAQTISLEGARLANFYIGLSVICFVVAYLLSAPRRRAATPAPAPRPCPTTPFVPDILAAVWVLASGAMLLHLVGGFASLVKHPGQAMAGGVTMFLLLTGLGKLPLLRKVASCQKINGFDLSLFVFVLFLFLGNSRFLAVFIVLQLAVLLNYCRREVPRRGLLGVALVLFLIVFVFGLYRDYTTFYKRVDWTAAHEFLMTRVWRSNALDWFYGVNVEGFAGLAGILTFATDHGGLAHDFGLSDLAVITTCVPYAARNDPSLPFKEIGDALRSLYPYDGSLIPSGMECAYAHFGLLGILGFGALLGYATRWLHAQMSDPKVDRLLVALLSIAFLHVIRGLYGATALLGFVEALLLWVYRCMRTVERFRCTSTPSAL